MGVIGKTTLPRAQEKVAALLRGQVSTRTDAAKINRLLNSYVKEWVKAARAAYDYPLPQSLPSGFRIFRLTPEERNSLRAALFDRLVILYGPGRGVKGRDRELQGQVLLFYQLLHRDRELGDDLLLSVIEMQACIPEACCGVSHGALVDLLFRFTNERGLSPEVCESLRPLVPESGGTEDNSDDEEDDEHDEYDDSDDLGFDQLDVLVARPNQKLPTPDPAPEIHILLETYLDEAALPIKNKHARRYNARSLDAGVAILTLPPEKAAAFVAPTLRALIVSSCIVSMRYWDAHYRQLKFLHDLFQSLTRKSLPIDGDQLSQCFLLLASAAKMAFWTELPYNALLSIAEDIKAKGPLSAALQNSAGELRRLLIERQTEGTRFTADERKALSRLELMLQKPGEESAVLPSSWGREVRAWMTKLSKRKQADWESLFAVVVQAAGKSRPSKDWAKSARAAADKIGREDVVGRIGSWLEAFPLDPKDPDINGDLIKGLIWTLGFLEHDGAAPLLGSFVKRCFSKVPRVGARSVKLGNAAIFALSCLEGTAAAAQLSGLKPKMKFPSVRKKIDQELLVIAERTGKSIGELEELAIPDFGLGPDGRKALAVGDFQALIEITGSDSVALTWRGSDGKIRKGVPAAVKREHAEALKDIKAGVKEIKEALSGQSARLEQLFLEQRSWSLAEWRARYTDHPLLSHLSRRLLWYFDRGDRKVAGLAEGGVVRDENGKALERLDDATRVTLWHPIDAEADNVHAWRRRLVELEITQPFKQAHREIYVLTDAERTTGIYSNRFASHIIKQHQFKALCQDRGWRYSFQLCYDSQNTPHRLLEAWDIRAEFWVNAGITEDMTEAGIYLYLGTDQVRFLDSAGTALELSNVPPVVFSEILRDADLFVAVASVGNDPNWVDGGHHERFYDYWQGFSFGDLTATAQTRREVLEGLLPRLKIAAQCELVGRFLMVRGHRRTYKIHLGSSNILMQPNDQYLCIVRGWDKGGDKLYLPFEGDGTLALILSKAFLLAADDKITDKTILSQIGR